jgi:hypothetical protein
MDWHRWTNHLASRVARLNPIEINDLQHPKAHIRDAVARITPKVLQAMWKEVKYHLDIVVPPRERALKFIEKVIYSEKNFNTRSFPL